jgi:hypothetical protein
MSGAWWGDFVPQCWLLSEHSKAQHNWCEVWGRAPVADTGMATSCILRSCWPNHGFRAVHPELARSASVIPGPPNVYGSYLEPSHFCYLGCNEPIQSPRGYMQSPGQVNIYSLLDIWAESIVSPYINRYRGSGHICTLTGRAITNMVVKASGQADTHGLWHNRQPHPKYR